MLENLTVNDHRPEMFQMSECNDNAELVKYSLAVLFVPSLFVVIQRFEEWRASRKSPRIQPAE